LLVFALIALACKDHEAEAAAVTKQYLAEIRAAIARYKAETGRYPNSLYDLTPKYVRTIRPDPLTSAVDWRVTTEETVQPSSDFQTTTSAALTSVVIDVHSSAPGADRNGVPYANY
jgi:type II secretory pathway pseudopilin PulG